jgi:hypothetical protein
MDNLNQNQIKNQQSEAENKTAQINNNNDK